MKNNRIEIDGVEYSGNSFTEFSFLKHKLKSLLGPALAEENKGNNDTINNAAAKIAGHESYVDIVKYWEKKEQLETLSDIDNLGFENIEQLKNQIASGEKIIIVCSDTGEGKTTTLAKCAQYSQKIGVEINFVADCSKDLTEDGFLLKALTAKRNKSNILIACHSICLDNLIAYLSSYLFKGKDANQFFIFDQKIKRDNGLISYESRVLEP